MKPIKPPLFTLSVISVILGVTLYKDFDMETLRFRNTALAVIYFIVLVFSLYVIAKYFKKR